MRRHATFGVCVSTLLIPSSPLDNSNKAASGEQLSFCARTVFAAFITHRLIDVMENSISSRIGLIVVCRDTRTVRSHRIYSVTSPTSTVQLRVFDTAFSAF